MAKKKTRNKVVTKKTASPKRKASAKKVVKSVKKKAATRKPPVKKAKSPAKAKAKAKVKAAKPSAPKAKKAAPKKAAPKSKASPKTAGKKTATTFSHQPEEIKEIKEIKEVKRAPEPMNPAVFKIRDRLLENRAEVLKMLESSQAMERDVEGLTFSNEIDLASSLEGREMIFQLSSRDRNELKLIDDALIRIKNGTYGICESCEKKISIKRLQILPLTPLCIECQESMEHG